MKKPVLLLVVFALSITAIVGCGSNGEPPSRATKTSGDLPADVQAIVERGELRVGVKADAPKFGLRDPDTGEFAGMEIDLAKAIAKRMGLPEDKVTFEAVTDETRGPLLDNGRVDLVIATFTIKPDRLEQWNFSVPYYHDEVGLLVKKDSGITSLKGLDGKKIGVAQGATTRDAVQAEAEKAGVKVEFVEFATYPEIAAALESGRVDAFSVDKSVLSGYVTDESVILPDGFSPQDYGIASRKGTDGLTDFINEALIEMEADGEKAALLKKWGLD